MAIGSELRDGRLAAGLTQRELGDLVGISPSEISRIERAQSPHVSYETLVLIASALGLDLPLRAFPSGDPVRDAAQIALLTRFRAELPRSIRHRAEVPLGIPGDRRAWDLVVEGSGWSMPVEAETRVRDVQALLRRIGLKCRDAGADGVVLLLADSRHNRHVLRLAESEFAVAFPADRREAWLALRAGRRPAGSCALLL
jgi:transcriptional regulator with XRE-family HTH domain